MHLPRYLIGISILSLVSRNVRGMRNSQSVLLILNKSCQKKAVSAITSRRISQRFSSTMVELNHDFFGETAVFGKDFNSAWDNIVKAVGTDNRKLYLVSDFDHTLTTFASKQCHDIIALHDEYPKEFHQEFNDICNMAFNKADLHNWWRMAHDLIVDRSGLTEEMFERGIKSAGIQLRSGTVELIAYCRDTKIPTIITSAGITNVIAAVLESHGVSSVHDEHFHIDANHMEWHADDGTLLRILPDVPVHSSAKIHVHKRASHMFTTINHGVYLKTVEFSEECFMEGESSPESPIVIEVITEDNEGNVYGTSTTGETVLETIQNDQLNDNNSSDNDNMSNKANEPKLTGVAAIILGDNAGDFEVLREVSDVNEAFLFRLGFAPNAEKADKLLALNCCDVILIGDENGAEVVLKLLKALVESKANKEATVGV